MSNLASYPQILCIGDSIVRRGGCDGGYVARLSDEYSGKYDVLNRGHGGYTSRQLLRKVKDDLYMSSPPVVVKLIVLHIGTNDSVTHGPQAVPVDEYKLNLQALISHFQALHPNTPIILLTPSTCNSETWGRGDRTPENSKVYAKACIEVAQRAGVLSLDTFTLIEEGLKSHTTNEIFTDGLHFATKGYSLISDALLLLIHSQLPHISPATIPYSFVTFDAY